MQVKDFHGKSVIDSREVAEMVDREHNALMKTIRSYCEYLRQGEIDQSIFFIESTYFNSQNHEMPNFLITKLGCEMIANKMTGKKGTLFTAAYVMAFNEMQQTLDAPQYAPEVSPNGLAKLIMALRKVMLDSGSNPQDVARMTQDIFRTWKVPIPRALQAREDPQISFSMLPELAAE